MLFESSLKMDVQSIIAIRTLAEIVATASENIATILSAMHFPDKSELAVIMVQAKS